MYIFLYSFSAEPKGKYFIFVFIFAVYELFLLSSWFYALGTLLFNYYGYSEASKIRFIPQVAGESAAGENFGKFLQNIDFVKEKV